ncbi:hypothetical protein CKM354_000642400 [Cercospora kikuchii]|uniref:Uncharacterized protein n=1 Tax=Cercospora kikuchii TaxID=84275 RepID=A0A9P3FDA9_9PEZI|nr:uncharacterized protein CKM354_000642400 [Cercospora kikuchii]GIZ43186.1 hypothetical protein CKM354_000642400 [Cercospora kikuchii]
MANPKHQEKLIYNYSTTWKRRVLLSAVALVVFVFAATAAGLSMRAIHNIWWQVDNQFTVYLNKDLWYGDVYFLPPDVRYASVWSTFSAGIVCAVVSGMCILFIMSATDEISTRRVHVLGIFWRSLGIFASLVALVWSFVEFYTSSTVNVGGILENVPTNEEPLFDSRPVDPIFTRKGTYGVERWSCQIEPLWKGYWPWYPYSRSSSLLPCADVRASRWLMLPLLMMSVVLPALTILVPWQSKAAAAVGTDQQMENAGGEVGAESGSARAPTPSAGA